MLYFKSLIIKIIHLLILILKRFVIIVFRSQYLKYQNKTNVLNEKFEELMDFKEMTKSKGFEVEEYKVITNDGYILTMHRIYYKNTNLKSDNSAKKKKRKRLLDRKINEEENTQENKKQAILLVHGIFDSSEGWICNDDDKCIPLILAKLGYDVWLGNSRGNKYSRDHVFLKTKGDSKNPSAEKMLKDEFWNFSFDEMGKYDLPAFIDQILNVNMKTNKIIYIGHSQGTTQVFSGLSENYEYYQNKIKLVLALAPVAKTKHLDSTLYDFFDIIKLDIISEKLGIKELFPFNKDVQLIFSFLFKQFPIIPSIATEIIGDKNSISYINYNKISVLFSHLPSGSSLKALNHLIQMFRSDKFCKYDHGEKLNLIKYGSKSPPEFNLDNIKNVPIALLSAKNDRLAHPKDVEWLNNQLKQNVIFSKAYENMGHISFQISDNFLWFEDVLKYVKKYSD